MTPIRTITLEPKVDINAMLMNMWESGAREDERVLSRYTHALAECVSTEPVTVELYDEQDLDDAGYLTDHGARIVWLADIKRAAVSHRQENYFEWTDASSPEDALRRWREGDMTN